MMWHVVFTERDGRVLSSAARSRDSGIHVACKLLRQAYDVRLFSQTTYRAARARRAL
jgi:hypothetical protein